MPDDFPAILLSCGREIIGDIAITEGDEPMNRGWFRPLGGAASTHVLKTSTLEDIPLLEFLCMRAAKELGIKVPSVNLLELSLSRPIFCVERFDRVPTMSDGALRVVRLHQEDLAQAFGIPPQAKYAELSPTTGSAIAGLLRDRSGNPVWRSRVKSASTPTRWQVSALVFLPGSSRP